MAEFITKEQFKTSYGRGKSFFDVQIRGLLGKLEQSTKENKIYDVSIFLSHSHKNKELVFYLVELLKSYGIKVYIDWLDDELIYPPSGLTAVKIKKMIKENKKFIFLATVEAIESKWCNWELGLGDSEKYIENIVLFPIAEDNGQWNGNEYLQIYPYVINQYKRFLDYRNYYIQYPGGKKVEFSKWLRS